MNPADKKELPAPEGPGLTLNDLIKKVDITINKNSHFVTEDCISARVVSGNVVYDNQTYTANTGFKIGVNGYISSEETAEVRLFYLNSQT